MGTIRCLFLFFALIVTLPIQASHNPKECSELEDLAVKLVSQMNSLFEMKIETEFIDKQNGPKGYPSLPPSLLDANSANETLQIPRPCLMSEEVLPSKELWSLIIAHEFSHKIIDQRQEKCIRVLMKNQTIATAELMERDQIHHTNNDVLALKILSELRVNGLSGIWDLGDYISRHRSEIGAEGSYSFEKRVRYMKRIWPTDFESGDDFLFGEYFDGLDEIKRHTIKSHPQSTLARDLQKGLDQIDGCLLVKPEKFQQSLLIWRSLDFTAVESKSLRQPGTDKSSKLGK